MFHFTMFLISCFTWKRGRKKGLTFILGLSVVSVCKMLGATSNINNIRFIKLDGNIEKAYGCLRLSTNSCKYS